MKPISYVGGKGNIAPQIVELLPPHVCYVEPWFGSGAVLFAKPKSKTEIVNDLDAELVHFFRMLRDHGPELQRRLTLTPYSREEHDRAKFDPQGGDDIERARKVFIRIQQSYSAILDTGWSRGIGSRNCATTFVNAVDRLLDAAERLRTVQIECVDALELIQDCDRKGVTVYADPPYVWATLCCPSKRYYAHEMSDADHEAMLATFCRYRRAAVVLSGYDCRLYNRELRKWDKYTIPVKLAMAHHTHGKPPRTEVIWIKK